MPGYVVDVDGFIISHKHIPNFGVPNEFFHKEVVIVPTSYLSTYPVRSKEKLTPAQKYALARLIIASHECTRAKRSTNVYLPTSCDLYALVKNEYPEVVRLEKKTERLIHINVLSSYMRGKVRYKMNE